jgi:hypothetical protein
LAQFGFCQGGSIAKGRDVPEVPDVQLAAIDLKKYVRTQA